MESRQFANILLLELNLFKNSFPLSVISTPDGSIVVLIASFPFSTVGIKGVCTLFISSACTKICNTST